MMVPTFIVGTGRCGSTMLPNMLREHPDALSLSEFFSMITAESVEDAPEEPERAAPKMMMPTPDRRQADGALEITAPAG